MLIIKEKIMTILETLNKIIRDYSQKDITVDENTEFSTMGFDSLDKVEVLMQLEETYDILFDDDMQANTVGELIKEIERLKK